MSNRDLQILTLWKTLSEREKSEVLKKIQAKAKQESKPKRELRPVWRFALDTVNALGVAMLFYVFIVAVLLLS